MTLSDILLLLNYQWLTKTPTTCMYELEFSIKLRLIHDSFIKEILPYNMREYLYEQGRLLWH